MPRLLDLYAGAGGAATGYHRAGFTEIVGVDNRPQPRYPFEFHCADALEFLRGVRPGEFDLIHASPPCQAFTNARVIHGHAHPDLLTPTRALLEALGTPYVIENVPGAPLRRDVVLCGSQFGEPRLKRHRLFECSRPIPHLLPPCAHGREIVSVFGHGGHIYHSVEDWRRVMGIDWMTRAELAQAIPPAYCQWVGARMLEALRDERRAATVTPQTTTRAATGETAAAR